MTKEQIQEKIKKKKERLELYYEKEAQMMSKDGVQSYGIGTRNVARYNIDLSNLRRMIKQLEDEIDELEARLEGIRPRKAVAVVPRDW